MLWTHLNTLVLPHLMKRWRSSQRMMAQWFVARISRPMCSRDINQVKSLQRKLS